MNLIITYILINFSSLFIVFVDNFIAKFVTNRIIEIFVEWYR